MILKICLFLLGYHGGIYFVFEVVYLNGDCALFSGVVLVLFRVIWINRFLEVFIGKFIQICEGIDLTRLVALYNIFNFLFLLLFAGALNVRHFSNCTRSYSHRFRLVAECLEHFRLEVEIDVWTYVLDILISPINMSISTLIDCLLVVIFDLCTKVVQPTEFKIHDVGFSPELNYQVYRFPVLHLFFIFLLALVTKSLFKSLRNLTTSFVEARLFENKLHFEIWIGIFNIILEGVWIDEVSVKADLELNILVFIDAPQILFSHLNWFINVLLMGIPILVCCTLQIHKWRVDSKSAEHFVVRLTCLALVHQLDENISAEFNVVVLEIDVYIFTCVSRNDVLIRVFVNQLIVFGVQELGLKSERVLDFWQVLDKDLLKLNWLRIECFPRKCLSKIKDISNLRSLRNTFPSRKSFPAIISDSILSIICKPSKQ